MARRSRLKRLNGDWSPDEDTKPSRSKLSNIWTAPEEMTWLMEVRETIGTAGSVRLGEVQLRGSFNGKLFLKIVSILDCRQ